MLVSEHINGDVVSVLVQTEIVSIKMPSISQYTSLLAAQVLQVTNTTANTWYLFIILIFWYYVTT